MFDKNASPNSLEFINALNDEMITARQILRLLADLSEQGIESQKNGAGCTIEYSSLCSTLNHVTEILCSAEDMIQLLWQASKNPNGNSPISDNKDK